MKTRQASSLAKTKNESSPATATPGLSKVHRTRSRVTKGASKALNTIVADALDKLPPGAQIRGNLVSVDLDDLRVYLNEASEGKRKLIWEGRYCDYLADVLGKVKSSPPWQALAPPNVRSEQWNLIKDKLDKEAEGGMIHVALHGAATHLKSPYMAIRSWIDVYVARCESPAHHGNLKTKLKSHEIDACRDQIWSDMEMLDDETPDEYQKHTSHVMWAIKDYQNTMFASCPKYGTCELTPHGKRIAGIP
jgi:hypothetical protein